MKQHFQGEDQRSKKGECQLWGTLGHTPCMLTDWRGDCGLLLVEIPENLISRLHASSREGELSPSFCWLSGWGRQ